MRYDSSHLLKLRKGRQQLHTVFKFLQVVKVVSASAHSFNDFQDVFGIVENGKVDVSA